VFDKSRVCYAFGVLGGANVAEQRCSHVCELVFLNLSKSTPWQRPVKKGEVVNWEELQAIVEHILRMELQIDEQDISVVLPVSVANREEREKLVKVCD